MYLQRTYECANWDQIIIFAENGTFIKGHILGLVLYILSSKYWLQFSDSTKNFYLKSLTQTEIKAVLLLYFGDQDQVKY